MKDRSIRSLIGATALLASYSLCAAVIRPDAIVAPDGVDVKVTDAGAVEVRAPDGVEEVSLFWKRPLSRSFAHSNTPPSSVPLRASNARPDNPSAKISAERKTGNAKKLGCTTVEITWKDL